MSLFTVIKYGHTSLGNIRDLQALPEFLLNTFYERLHTLEYIKTSMEGIEDSNLMKCAVLVNIYNKWYKPVADNKMKSIFEEILMEYEDESI